MSMTHGYTPKTPLEMRMSIASLCTAIEFWLNTEVLQDHITIESVRFNEKDHFTIRFVRERAQEGGD